MPNIYKKIENIHSIYFSYVIPMGAINENKRQSGITHLIEHLCFRRAADLSQKEIYDICERNGVKINGITGKNFLLFSFYCRPEVFDETINLLHKMISLLNYTEKDLIAEKQIVLSEIAEKEETNEKVIVNRLWTNRAFANSILGNETSLHSITLSDIIKTKRKILSVGGTAFLIGNFSDSQKELVDRLFVTNNSDKVESHIQIKNDSFSKNSLSIIKDDYDDCDVYYAFHLKFPQEDKVQKFISVDMIHSALCQGDTAYFKEILREKFGLIYEIYSSLYFLEDEVVLLIQFSIDSSRLCSLIRELEDSLNTFILDERYFGYLKAFYCDNLSMTYDNMKDYAEEWVDNHINCGMSLSPDEKAKAILNITLSEYNEVYRDLLKTKKIYIFGNVSSKQKKELQIELNI